MQKKLFRKALLVLPLGIGALAYGSMFTHGKATKPQVVESGYTCPVTGEQLPCPKCCPLNQKM